MLLLAPLWQGLLTVPLRLTEGLPEPVELFMGSWGPSVEGSGMVRKPCHNGVEGCGMVS